MARTSWVLSAREGFLKFNAGCKSLGERMDLTASMPSDYNQGWMHVILVVDRSASKASIYYDFELEMEEPVTADVLTATDIAASKSFYK